MSPVVDRQVLFAMLQQEHDKVQNALQNLTVYSSGKQGPNSGTGKNIESDMKLSSTKTTALATPISHKRFKTDSQASASGIQKNQSCADIESTKTMSQHEEVLTESQNKIAVLNSYLSTTMSTRYADIYHPRVDIRKISK